MTADADADAEYELDVIIYATGFDAVTGELARMDICGTNGQTLKDKWDNGASTYLTLQTAGFPNLLIVNGAVFCNFTRCVEVVGEWVANCLSYMRDKGYQRIEADAAAEEAWSDHAESLTDVIAWYFLSSSAGGQTLAKCAQQACPVATPGTAMHAREYRRLFHRQLFD